MDINKIGFINVGQLTGIFMLSGWLGSTVAMANAVYNNGIYYYNKKDFIW